MIAFYKRLIQESVSQIICAPTTLLVILCGIVNKSPRLYNYKPCAAVSLPLVTLK